MRGSKYLGLISIFGYSKTFAARDGLCDDCNARACDLTATANPGFLVRWSNRGYAAKDEQKVDDWVKCSEPAA
jgi:hypothetical protein